MDQAFKVLCPKAGPVLMEPIMKVEVVTPEENMGDVIGDLNKRRGMVQVKDALGAQLGMGDIVADHSLSSCDLTNLCHCMLTF